MKERHSVRVILLSPEKRVLLFKYLNTGPDGAPDPSWTLPGGGREGGETVEQTALREVREETGMHVTLGPVVWYGEDARRCRAWEIRFHEHFIVAFAPSETVDRSQWTEHEQRQITHVKWWRADELRVSDEPIFPRDLGLLLAPLLEGRFPESILTLPPI